MLISLIFGLIAVSAVAGALLSAASVRKPGLMSIAFLLYTFAAIASISLCVGMLPK